MPLDAFMYFGKNNEKVVVEGESSDDFGKGFKPFEIISFEWGAYIGKKEVTKEVTTEGTTKEKSHYSGHSETVSHREVTVDNIKVSKPFDSASLGLFMACTNPKCVFEDATIIFRKSGGGDPFIFLKFVFKKVRVDSVEWKLESMEGDKPDQEDLRCSFEEVEMFYSPQTETGAKALSFGGGTKKTASFKRSTATS